jgi:hypothetical protein
MHNNTKMIWMKYLNKNFWLISNFIHDITLIYTNNISNMEI